MKYILIVCVNYNSYPELKNYLASIEASVVACSLLCQVDVWVADNSSEKEVVDTVQYKHISVQVKPQDNLGYLGGATAIINNLSNLGDYDFVIISNVDILFTDTTITEIVRIQMPQEVIWISPQRYSTKYNMILNVEKKKRPSKWKMFLYMLFYKFPLLQSFQHMYTIRRYKKRSFDKKLLEPTEIYIGCGSCFILTRDFFNFFPKLDYPLFLYGEEMFLAELVRSVRRKVMYYPSIKIYNIGSVSTGKLNSRRFCMYNYMAVRYIYNRFYKSFADKKGD